MFNCTSFFDEIILRAFEEYNLGLVGANMEEIEKWL